MDEERAPVGRAPAHAYGRDCLSAGYAWSLSFSSELRAGLWGGVPPSIQPLYTTNMLLAAARYYPFTWVWPAFHPI